MGHALKTHDIPVVGQHQNAGRTDHHGTQRGR